jgi:glycosyltransferase involved in cell wall biosynthesis
MKISVLIPIYNSSHYISECLLSIQKQLFTDFEVICIDDGSIDNSLEICKSFAKKDSRFKVYTQENRGVSAARNKALDYCSGEYIVFVDSDDVIDKSYLSRLYSFMKPNVDIVYGQFCREKNELGIRKKGAIHEILPREEFVRKLINKKIYFPTICSMLFKRSIITKNSINFDTNIYWGEDSLFYHEYIAKMNGNIASSDVAIYYYRHNESSAMNNVVTYKALTAIDASQKTEELLRNAGIYPCDSTSIVSETVLKLLYIATVSKNLELYDCLHIQYDVKKHIKHMAKKSKILKLNLLSKLYLVLGRKNFYMALKFTTSIFNR